MHRVFPSCRNGSFGFQAMCDQLKYLNDKLKLVIHHAFSVRAVYFIANLRVISLDRREHLKLIYILLMYNEDNRQSCLLAFAVRSVHGSSR